MNSKPSMLASGLRSSGFRRTLHSLSGVEKLDSKESVEELLRGLLNPMGTMMSPFRVLYNLEVIE